MRTLVADDFRHSHSMILTALKCFAAAISIHVSACAPLLSRGAVTSTPAAGHAQQIYQSYPDVQDDRCYTASDHDTADLCAQWRAAYAAEAAANQSWWANVLSTLAVLLSGGGLLGLLAALRQTESSLVQARKSASETLKIGKAQVRCYVSLLQCRAYVAPGNTRPVLSFILKNNGASPALGLKISTSIRYAISNVHVGNTPDPKWSPELELSSLSIDIPPGETVTTLPYVINDTISPAGILAISTINQFIFVEAKIKISGKDVFDDTFLIEERVAGHIHSYHPDIYNLDKLFTPKPPQNPNSSSRMENQSASSGGGWFSWFTGAWIRRSEAGRCSGCRMNRE